MYYRHTGSCFSQAHPTGVTLPLPSLAEYTVWFSITDITSFHALRALEMWNGAMHTPGKHAYNIITHVQMKRNKGRVLCIGFLTDFASHASFLPFYFRHIYPYLRSIYVFILFNFLYLKAGSAAEAELYCAMISMPSQGAFVAPVRILQFCSSDMFKSTGLWRSKIKKC